MDKQRTFKTSRRISPFTRTAVVLQGGGALGAYQAGVYEVLSEAGYEPHWIDQCGDHSRQQAGRSRASSQGLLAGDHATANGATSRTWRGYPSELQSRQRTCHSFFWGAELFQAEVSTSVRTMSTIQKTGSFRAHQCGNIGRPVPMTPIAPSATNPGRKRQRKASRYSISRMSLERESNQFTWRSDR